VKRRRSNDGLDRRNRAVPLRRARRLTEELLRIRRQLLLSMQRSRVGQPVAAARAPIQDRRPAAAMRQQRLRMPRSCGSRLRPAFGETCSNSRGRFSGLINARSGGQDAIRSVRRCRPSQVTDTMPGFHEGRAPRNKGRRYPGDPPTVEEIIAVMRAAGTGADGARLRALIVILWRAGLRSARRSISPRLTSMHPAARFRYDGARAGVVARSRWIAGRGVSWSRGSPAGVRCPSERCCV
jgi:hypothetical protein